MPETIGTNPSGSPSLRAQPLQGRGADFHVAVFVDLRIERVPELLQKLVEKVEGRREQREAFAADVGIHQPHRDLQVLTAFGENLAGRA